MSSDKSTLNSFIKVGAIYTLSNVIVKGIAFLTTPLFTRLMSQSEYGEFNSIASWVNIISVVVTLNLYSSINRAKYDYESTIDKYMSSILILGAVFSGISWTIIEYNINFFERIFLMDRIYIRSIMLYASLSPVIQTLLAKYRMFNEYKKVIILTWITLLTSTVSSLILVIIMENKLLGRVIGNYVLISIISIALGLLIIVRGRSFSLKHCVYALTLAVPLIPHELSGILLSSSDRIIIGQLCGAEEAALYSLASTVGMIITVLLSSLNQAWVPWFYDNIYRKNTNIIQKVSKWYIRLFMVGCIGLMLVGPELIMIFGGKSYMSAVYVIPPICMAVGLQFIYTLYVNIEFYMKKTSTISIATVLATIVNILLNYIMIPIFGYIAAAYTTVAGYMLMAIFHYFAVYQKTPYGHLYDKRDIVACILLLGAAIGVSMMLYNHIIIRYIIILLYIIGIMLKVYKNKSEIKKIFKDNGK